MKKQIFKPAFLPKAPLYKNSYFSFLSSWWIANLGVVPLLIFAAFLLAPILTFFLDLLFLVTRVFDTIIVLPIEYISKKLIIIYHNKHTLLPKITSSVKVSLPIFTIILILSHPIYGKDQSKITQKIILAKGQHHEIIDLSLDNYTIGNKEVISHKYSRIKNKMIIKGKMLGFSEIIIWKNSKKIHIYKIYVFSKKQQLELLNLASALKSLNLNPIIAGPIIKIHGHIENMPDYLLYKKVISNKSNMIFEQVSFSQKIRNLVIGEVYYHFYNDYIDSIYCKNQKYAIHCFYSSSQKPKSKILKRLKNKFGVSFFTHSRKNRTKNFKIKLKLIQLEKLNGQELNFGLSKLSTSLNDLMKYGVVAAIKDNQINLQNHDIFISTLAEPNALLGLDNPLLIKIGSEIPFLSNDKTKNTKTLWKFAGLKVKISISQKGNAYQLNYQTQINKPGKNKSITGSEERSSIYIKLNEPVEIFSIGYKTTKSLKSGFPLLSKIPILGKLFSSHSQGNNFKKISAIIILEQL